MSGFFWRSTKLTLRHSVKRPRIAPTPRLKPDSPARWRRSVSGRSQPAATKSKNSTPKLAGTSARNLIRSTNASRIDAGLSAAADSEQHHAKAGPNCQYQVRRGKEHFVHFDALAIWRWIDDG